MSTDGDIDFSQYSDADLSASAENIDVNHFPRNSRALVRELQRRWASVSAENSRLTVSGVLGDPQRFQDLPHKEASKVFWPYCLWAFLIGLFYAIGISIISLGVEYLLILFAAIRGAPVQDPQSIYTYTSIILALLLGIPMTRFTLSWMTRRPFGGSVIRIVPLSTERVL
jgi:hypothetical protein